MYFFKKNNIFLLMLNIFYCNITIADLDNNIDNKDIETIDSIFNIENESLCKVNINLVDKISAKKINLSINHNIPKVYKNLQIKLNKCYRNLNNNFAYIEIKEYLEEKLIQQDNKQNDKIEYNYSIDSNIQQKSKIIFSGWIMGQDMLFNNIKHKKYDFFIENINSPIILNTNYNVF
ncbi:MAG: DUF2155 domain-containing protein [Rickettsiales bacterium]